MALLSFNNVSGPEATIYKLLKHLKIDIDPEKITAEFDKHPDYPSLLAISDALTALGVETSAFRLDFEELGEVECPFIAHTNDGGLVLVNRIENGNFYVSNDRWDNHKMNTEKFKPLYGGVVLIVEASQTTALNQRPVSILKTIKSPALILSSLLVLAIVLVFHTDYFSGISWQLLSLSLFKTAGLITAILLLVQAIDSNNPMVQVLCKGVGKSDCDAILSSKAAKVFDGLSWSEVGFFYFGGTWLLLLFGGGSPAVWQALALLNFVSLPYTVYSIYYQARVAKQWCVLCCTVQALLWLEFIPLVYQFKSMPLTLAPGWGGAWSTVLVCMAVPVILWVSIKPLFLKLQTLKPLKNQLRKFKYNADLFNRILTEQPRFAAPEESWSIVLGNAESENIITMVTNPYCPPCAKTHKLLDEFLEERMDVQARIVFTASNDEKDRKTPISRHLMALNELADKTIVRKALHDWYEQTQKNYETWAKVYPVELKETEFYKIDRQRDWCKMAEVEVTPTMLINGYRMPELYQLPDLKYMLE
jgi:uncharacterized membrane protein